jgi:hypothetical protein
MSDQSACDRDCDNALRNTVYYTVDIVHFGLAVTKHMRNVALLMVVRLNDYLAYGQIDDLSECIDGYLYLLYHGATVDMPKAVLAAAAIEGLYDL